MRRAFVTAAALGFTLSLAGCDSIPVSKQTQGAALGAAAGGVAGHAVSGGSTLGTVGGAAVGGVIGSELGRRQETK
ncbi:MAG TPA: glycine zipper 2TM domain-containing protein [Burkholderiales bacterium]|nr:glycine zipper 2TM domain-containing protein [Burkholderiales bacterium]